MRKKILILLTLFILFTITGCGSKTGDNLKKKEGVPVIVDGEEFILNSTSNLNRFYYLVNYVDFNTDALGNMRLMRYRKKDETVFEVRIMYETESTFEENINSVKHKPIDRKINNIDYKFFNYVSKDGYTIHTYMTYYDNATYVVTFISLKDIATLEKAFMNNTYFK